MVLLGFPKLSKAHAYEFQARHVFEVLPTGDDKSDESTDLLSKWVHKALKLRLLGSPEGLFRWVVTVGD